MTSKRRTEQQYQEPDHAFERTRQKDDGWEIVKLLTEMLAASNWVRRASAAQTSFLTHAVPALSFQKTTRCLCDLCSRSANQLSTEERKEPSERVNITTNGEGADGSWVDSVTTAKYDGKEVSVALASPLILEP